MSGYQHSLEQFCQGPLQQHPVYHNNQQAGHVQALSNNYPLTRHLCSDHYFFPLAKAYQHHTLQSDWDINIYGEDFPQWLSDQQYGPTATLKDWSLLSELAAFEYQLIILYYQLKTYCPQQPLAYADQLLPALQHFHPYLDCSAADSQQNCFDLTSHLSANGFSISVENPLSPGGYHD